MIIYLAAKRVIAQISIYALSVCVVTIVGALLQFNKEHLALYVIYSIVVSLFNVLPAAVLFIMLYNRLIKEVTAVDEKHFLKWSTLISGGLVLLLLLAVAEIIFPGLSPAYNQDAWGTWLYYIAVGVTFAVLDFYIRIRRK